MKASAFSKPPQLLISAKSSKQCQLQRSLSSLGEFKATDKKPRSTNLTLNHGGRNNTYYCIDHHNYCGWQLCDDSPAQSLLGFCTVVSTLNRLVRSSCHPDTLPYVVFAVIQRQPPASKLFIFQAQCRTNVRPDVWGDAERLQMKGCSMCRHRLKCSVACQAGAGVITDPPPAGFEKRTCSRHPGVTAEAACIPHFLLSTSSFLPLWVHFLTAGGRKAINNQHNSLIGTL